MNQLGGKTREQIRTDARKIIDNDKKTDLMNLLSNRGFIIFKELIFPSINLNGNYIGYEANLSLEYVAAGSFGIVFVFTDDEGYDYALKCSRNADRYRDDRYQLFDQGKIQIIDDLSVKHHSPHVMRIYQVVDLGINPVGPYKFSLPLLPMDTQKALEATKANYEIAFMITERGKFDLRPSTNWGGGIDPFGGIPFAYHNPPYNTDFGKYLELTGRPIELFYLMVADLLAGMIFMHNYGWIHCDVKPENVMAAITAEGIKFMFIDVDGAQRGIPDANGIMYAQNVVGTPVFEAPERVHGNLPGNEIAEIYEVIMTCAVAFFHEDILGQLYQTQSKIHDMTNLIMNYPSQALLPDGSPDSARAQTLGTIDQTFLDIAKHILVEPQFRLVPRLNPNFLQQIENFYGMTSQYRQLLAL